MIDLCALSLQLVSCRSTVAELTMFAENPEIDPETGENPNLSLVKVRPKDLAICKSRVREVEHKRIDPEALKEKYQHIEHKLSNYNNKIMELDLLLQAITRLQERMQSDVDRDR